MVQRPPPRPVRHVRIGEADWRLIEAAAAAEETYPSTWLRAVAIREARHALTRGESKPRTGQVGR